MVHISTYSRGMPAADSMVLLLSSHSILPGPYIAIELCDNRIPGISRIGSFPPSSTYEDLARCIRYIAS